MNWSTSLILLNLKQYINKQVRSMSWLLILCYGCLNVNTINFQSPSHNILPPFLEWRKQISKGKINIHWTCNPFNEMLIIKHEDLPLLVPAILHFIGQNIVRVKGFPSVHWLTLSRYLIRTWRSVVANNNNIVHTITQLPWQWNVNVSFIKIKYTNVSAKE